MARELHDTVVQDLIVIVMQLRGAIETQDAMDRSRRTLEGFHAAEQALNTTRGLLQGLRETVTRQIHNDRPGSCSEQIDTVLRTVFKHSELQTDVRCATPVEMPRRMIREVSGIVREAANNVKRHARASTITCTIEKRPDALCIDVIDDGIGFSRARKSAGFGMLGMHERARLIGATLTIRSEPERGSVVRLIIPACQLEQRAG